MDVLRTPDERFTDLPDFPYAPRYVDLDGARMAYVEAGPADGPTVLLLHGEPSWSFLYRKVMAVLADAGCHAIAPDLIGFGRSAKGVELDVSQEAARRVGRGAAAVGGFLVQDLRVCGVH